jgi:serpin B
MNHATIRCLPLPTIRCLPLLAAIVAMSATGCARDPREITSADGDMLLLVEGNNQFSVDLYNAARDLEQGNLFFSPFSINAAMSMVLGGAEGDTYDQIATAMYVPDDEMIWHDNLAALFNDLSGQHHRAYTLFTANAAWGQEGYGFRQTYLDLLDGTYGAPLEETDFRDDPSGAMKDVNAWTKEQTKGHIEDLFSGDDINSYTKLVLVNAIYFKADWTNQFPNNNTVDGTFHRREGGGVTVPMMSEEADYRIANYDDLQVLEMCYEDDEIAMLVVLPDEVDGLPAIEDELSAELVNQWIGDLRDEEITVEFPRFELDTELPLMEVLENLGIVDALDADLADFTGIVPADVMEGNLYIGAAKHKAYVKVDEQGTEAAAATGISMMDGAMAEPDHFVADHPFLYLIRDKLTGAILFMGRIEDPS